MRRAAASFVLLIACSRGRADSPAPIDPGPDPDEALWHVQDVPECGFQVELPGPVHRAESVQDGVRVVAYRTEANPVTPSTFVVTCGPPQATSPAEILRADHDLFRRKLDESGVEHDLGVTDPGPQATRDGGRWSMRFSDGSSMNTAVHVTTLGVGEIDAPLEPGEPSKASDRVLQSFHAR